MCCNELPVVKILFQLSKNTNKNEKKFGQFRARWKNRFGTIRFFFHFASKSVPNTCSSLRYNYLTFRKKPFNVVRILFHL